MKKTDRKQKSPPRRSKAERLRSDTLRAMLLPPILCAALCLVCLCGLSWAWFTVSVSAGTSSVSGAQYNISAQVMQGDAPVAMENGGFALFGNMEYDVTLTAEGTASTGYCVVTLTGETTKTFTTAQIAPGESISFKLIPEGDTTLAVAAHWGVSSAETLLQNGDTIVELVTIPDEETLEAVVSPSETEQTPTPSESPAPSVEPTNEPTNEPSNEPTSEPTASPAASENADESNESETIPSETSEE